MAYNKNALIRYKTIDKCLQNSYKKWTLNDLITACSDALYEYEGKDVNVGKRTLQLDIQTLRSDKLGYNAPIEVCEKKYYRYADENYSISNIPFTEKDLEIMFESVEVLKQFRNFSFFEEMSGVIHKIEDKIYAEKSKSSPVIYLDKNDRLKGLSYLDVVYRAITKKIVLEISYQSFSSREAHTFYFHPFILREFNNRWFVVGVREENKKHILTLALDRIEEIDINFKKTYYQNNFDGNEYYKNTIGVTVKSEREMSEIIFRVDAKNAPYVETKPFHHSQKTLNKDEDGWVTFSMKVTHNFELERLLFGFADSLEVLAPKRLRRAMKKKFRKGMNLYDT